MALRSAVFILGVVFWGCATPVPSVPLRPTLSNSATPTPTPVPSVRVTATPTRIATPTPVALYPGAAAYEACMEGIGPFVDALTMIDSSVDVGIDLTDYTVLVATAEAAFDRLDLEDVDGIDPECRAAVDDARTALRLYIDAGRAWSDCLQSPPVCERQSGIAATVRPAWLLAEGVLGGLDDHLDALLRGPY